KPVAVTSNRGLGKVPIRPGANHQVELQYYQSKYTHSQPERADDDLPVTPSQDIPNFYGNSADQDAAALSMAEIASCSYEASYTHDIEALSCDEALIDASSLLTEVGVSPDDLAKAIRGDIEEKTGCCASVGMGSNILLARLATRKAKPNGQYFLRSEEVDDFIRDLPVTSLPGGHTALHAGLLGQLIASAVIKLLHAMKLQVQDLRGVGIQVQQLEGNRLQPQDCRGSRTRSIKDMLLGQGSNSITNKGLI
ncbi:hypothetical protein XENOCAPTIV_015998, partial [Xenoophorus captivus]